jgi:hypothetical protein
MAHAARASVGASFAVKLPGYGPLQGPESALQSAARARPRSHDGSSEASGEPRRAGVAIPWHEPEPRIGPSPGDVLALTEMQRALSSKGGRASHVHGRAHEFTPDEAWVAGRKGGAAIRARPDIIRAGEPRDPADPRADGHPPNGGFHTANRPLLRPDDSRGHDS